MYLESATCHAAMRKEKLCLLATCLSPRYG